MYSRGLLCSRADRFVDKISQGDGEKKSLTGESFSEPLPFYSKSLDCDIVEKDTQVLVFNLNEVSLISIWENS